jgi:hypothetical protein
MARKANSTILLSLPAVSLRETAQTFHVAKKLRFPDLAVARRETWMVPRIALTT